jgi:hypothetical protein
MMTPASSPQSDPKPQPHVFLMPTVEEMPRPVEPAGVAAQW